MELVPGNTGTPPRPCARCGASLVGKRADAKFCSRPCARSAYYAANRARELAKNAAWVAERTHYRRDQSRRLNAQEIAARARDLAECLASSHKSCTACLRYLPKTEYYSDPRRRDGLYSRCKSCQREAQRRTEDRVRSRDRARERYQNDPDYQATRRAAHRRWSAENPEKNREYASRRRALTAAPAVDYPGILAAHGMVCHLCQGQIPELGVLHFDHVVPLARGGVHAASNIRPSHAVCNLRKGAKLMSELDWVVT